MSAKYVNESHRLGEGLLAAEKALREMLQARDALILDGSGCTLRLFFDEDEDGERFPCFELRIGPPREFAAVFIDPDALAMCADDAEAFEPIKRDVEAACSQIAAALRRAADKIEGK